MTKTRQTKRKLTAKQRVLRKYPEAKIHPSQYWPNFHILDGHCHGIGQGLTRRATWADAARRLK